MAALTAKEAAPAAPSAAPAGRPAPSAAGATGWRHALRVVSVGLILLAAGVLGFVGYLFGISRVQEARAQTALYATLAGQLGNEIGPLGPTRPGAPVAIMNIPAIGVRHLVVVEGTSPQNMTLGPGHLRSTPLPGQLGVSVIYGRRATFGAPFAALPWLRPGDTISVTTQQGTASYKVVAVGGSHAPVRDTAPNRLVLLTASSATVPAYYVEVDAQLTSAPHQGPASLPATGPAESALAGDPNALVPAMLWGLALAMVSVAGCYGAVRWSPLPAYLAATPVAVALLWHLYQSTAAVLPNLY